MISQKTSYWQIRLRAGVLLAQASNSLCTVENIVGLPLALIFDAVTARDTNAHLKLRHRRLTRPLSL